MGKYKVLALDLDGTLTRNDKTISPAVLSSLIDAQKRGVCVALVSGRPTCGVTPLADELRLKEYGGYIISFNGGQIIDCSSGEVVHSQMLPKDEIPYLYGCSKRYEGTTIMTYCGNEIVTELSEYPYVMRAAYINRVPIRKVDDFEKEVVYDIPKCQIVGEPDVLEQLEREMNDELKGRISVFRSEPFFLEIVASGINKADSLSRLLGILGEQRECLVACGDGYNDIEMIEYAGVGVAMSNARDVVKEKSDYVTERSNEEDGIAEVVEKFFR